MKLPQRTAAVRIALPYLIVAAVYSLVSHFVLAILYTEWTHIPVDVMDDMLLIGLTGLLLYVLLRREEREWHRVDALRQKANA